MVLEALDAAAAVLVSPVVLFFVLGFGAGLARSDLAIPDALAKGLALYLMLAIGFKGGVETAHTGLTAPFAGAAAVGLVASFGMPLIAFAALRRFSGLDRVDAASIAAHYGSISVVTFVAANDYTTSLGLPSAGFLVAVVAMMETPAIISGLWLAHREGSARGPGMSGELLREVLLNGSIVLLVGSLVIGTITGDAGFKQVEPFIGPPFKGVLCLFLLDMGLAAASRIRGARHLNRTLVLFGLFMPLVGASIGLAGSLLVGLSPGSGTLLTTLCASASYIAVPAAMRVALPTANPAYSLTLSLGVTFPFNLVLGIPLYAAAATFLLG